MNSWSLFSAIGNFMVIQLYWLQEIYHSYKIWYKHLSQARDFMKDKELQNTPYICMRFVFFPI